LKNNIYFSDSTVFDIFNYKFVLGSPDGALTEPNTIVVTESFCIKVYRKKNPVGEELKTSNFGNFRVTGVIEDVPSNSHLKFDCLLSMATVVELVGWITLTPVRLRLSGIFRHSPISSFTGMRIYRPSWASSPSSMKVYDALGNQINASFTLRATRNRQGTLKPGTRV
jgi:hypothetical protein